jgi:hypothetical protein
VKIGAIPVKVSNSTGRALIERFKKDRDEATAEFKEKLIIDFQLVDENAPSKVDF